MTRCAVGSTPYLTAYSYAFQGTSHPRVFSVAQTSCMSSVLAQNFPNPRQNLYSSGPTVRQLSSPTAHIRVPIKSCYLDPIPIVIDNAGHMEKPEGPQRAFLHKVQTNVISFETHEVHWSRRIMGPQRRFWVGMTAVALYARIFFFLHHLGLVGVIVCAHIRRRFSLFEHSPR